MDPKTRLHRIVKADPGCAFSVADDHVAIEEPLVIQIACGESPPRTISTTMRTPGEDEELATGFLRGEGILETAADIDRIERCGTPVKNIVRIHVSSSFEPRLHRLERHVYTSSACGVCGKTSLEAIATAATGTLSSITIEADVLRTFPATLRRRQDAFDSTGGLHAAALFAPGGGDLLSVREDVGRHNAVDKLVGAEVLARRSRMTEVVLLVSSRASFELVQKAVMAGIPVLAAIGAPSSLAVELARERNLTLVGFLRNDRFNIYSAPERILSGV